MYEFDLNRAIEAWRHSLKTNRSLLDEDLDELENHLRDHVDELVAEGTGLEEAYRRALRRLGDYTDLDSEFGKVRFGVSKRRRSLARELAWTGGMLGNFIKTSLRNVKRHRGFAAINLGGLAVGLAGCLLMGLYVQNELSYDHFHVKKDRIYRLGNSTVGWPYGRILKDEYPEVEDVVYMRSYPTFSIKHDGRYLYEKMLYADADFFRLFDFPILEGNSETALTTAYSAVISRTLAERLFAGEPALGKPLVMADTLDFVVTGVVDVPRNSHIQFDVLLSLETLRALQPEWYEYEMASGWLDLNAVNYVLLRSGVDVAAFQTKIRNLPQERAADYLAGWGGHYELALTPMTKIYLDSDVGNSVGPQSDMAYVYLLSTVGVFLLLIAAINFVNLSTARSSDRAKEVGMRKTIGSSRGVLVGQFLVGSLITCAMAIVIAVAVARAALPYFNALAGTAYTWRDFLTPSMAVFLLSVLLVVSFLAGLYPALSLSGFSPIDALRSKTRGEGGGGFLRKALVVLQFSISGALILGTFVVSSQLRFMQAQDLGFEPDQVLVLDARQGGGAERAQKTEAMREALLDAPGVISVSNVYTVPGRNGWNGQLSFPEGMPDGQSVSLEYYPVGWDFVKTFGLQLAAGRTFESDNPVDATQSVLINEAALGTAGWSSPEEAIGKKFTSPGSGKPDGVVIGVLKNYHQHGLQGRIGPMMFGIRAGNGLYAIRYAAGSTADVLRHASATWQQFFGEYPYELFFLNDDFARQYDEEQRLLRIFGTFSMLTILIACLGLIGLAAYTAANRTKEIGVRKVMGATISQLVALLTREFLLLVGLSLLVALPAGYFLLDRWLDDFAYRTYIGVGILAATAALLVVISFLSVAYQALRAASSDPVESLRYE